MQERNKESAWTLVKAFVGGAAGMLATYALKQVAAPHIPAMDSKAKQLAVDAGVSLTASAIGNFVAKDVSDSLEMTKVSIDTTRDTLEELKSDKDGKSHILIEDNVKEEVADGRA